MAESGALIGRVVRQQDPKEPYYKALHQLATLLLIAEGKIANKGINTENVTQQIVPAKSTIRDYIDQIREALDTGNLAELDLKTDIQPFIAELIDASGIRSKFSARYAMYREMQKFLHKDARVHAAADKIKEYRELVVAAIEQVTSEPEYTVTPELKEKALALFDSLNKLQHIFQFPPEGMEPADAELLLAMCPESILDYCFKECGRPGIGDYLRDVFGAEILTNIHAMTELLKVVAKYVQHSQLQGDGSEQKLQLLNPEFNKIAANLDFSLAEIFQSITHYQMPMAEVAKMAQADLFVEAEEEQHRLFTTEDMSLTLGLLNLSHLGDKVCALGFRDFQQSIQECIEKPGQYQSKYQILYTMRYKDRIAWQLLRVMGKRLAETEANINKSLVKEDDLNPTIEKIALDKLFFCVQFFKYTILASQLSEKFPEKSKIIQTILMLQKKYLSLREYFTAINKVVTEKSNLDISEMHDYLILLQGLFTGATELKDCFTSTAVALMGQIEELQSAIDAFHGNKQDAEAIVTEQVTFMGQHLDPSQTSLAKLKQQRQKLIAKLEKYGLDTNLYPDYPYEQEVDGNPELNHWQLYECLCEFQYYEAQMRVEVQWEKITDTIAKKTEVASRSSEACAEQKVDPLIAIGQKLKQIQSFRDTHANFPHIGLDIPSDDELTIDMFDEVIKACEEKLKAFEPDDSATVDPDDSTVESINPASKQDEAVLWNRSKVKHWAAASSVVGLIFAIGGFFAGKANIMFSAFVGMAQGALYSGLIFGLVLGLAIAAATFIIGLRAMRDDFTDTVTVKEDGCANTFELDPVSPVCLNAARLQPAPITTNPPTEGASSPRLGGRNAS